MVAVVAQQAACIRKAVQGEWHIAAWTANDKAAIATEYKGSRPTPVEEENGLLASVQGMTERILERPAKDAPVAGA
jgi:hypothetical protein